MMYFPHDFQPRRGELYAEQVPVRRIAEATGTPVYIYSRKTLMDHYRKLHQAFRSVAPLICFSVKSNGNLAILKLLVDAGAGLDIVSGGELYKARRVGCPAERIVFASVGKRAEEIRESLRLGIRCFNVESTPELEAIDRIARQMKTRARVALRVNPDVDAHTHRHITTGIAASKFGIDLDTAADLVRHHGGYRGVEILGVHLHIGSQITQAAPFLLAIERAAGVIRAGRRAGLAMSWLNLGGGLGIIYKDESPQTPQAFAAKVVPVLKRLDVRLILEPGRFIVGNAGILVTQVLYVKRSRGKQFAVVDAGMTELIRPALYDAYHGVVRVARPDEQANGYGAYDVVGPVCESADVLARNRALGAVSPGDYLAVLGAGAYGSVMTSNYNGRLRPAEVLVRGRRWALIRKRETMRDLIRQDVLPKKWMT